MGILLIVIGIIWILFWTNDFQKGKTNFDFLRPIHAYAGAGCIFQLIGLLMIIIGIVVLF